MAEDQQKYATEYGDLLPVILGGDVGAYALGLECFEAFGVRSLAVANEPVEIISKSTIFDCELIPAGISDQELMAILQGIAAVHPRERLVLLANTDSRIGFFARNRIELEKYFAVPFPTQESIDLLSKKDSFARICADNGVRTPATVVVNFEGADEESWAGPEIAFDFPVVAKANSGDAYDALSFPGKKKIWYVDSAADLDELWVTLREAGFRDSFLVQELIPGDDSHMRSLTFYVDSTGRVTLRAGARVLLQDPSPAMIGNPVAMITEQYPELWEQAEAVLRAGDYRGFANFDIKIDPRDQTPVFLEVNPRIGRNSYYVAAAGANPMVPMARDLLGGETAEPEVAAGRVLYSLVPSRLITKYVSDPDALEQAQELIAAGSVVDPLESPVETNRQRWATALLQKLNYYRKFKRDFRAED